MGKPSDKRFSARRPGRRERARVKKRRRAQASVHVGGASLYSGKLGRKHLNRWHRYANRWMNAFNEARDWQQRHRGISIEGDSVTPKVAARTRTATLQPF